MKVNRRDFLSFVIGGAAGTALSPLPWKLQDDSAIWSQMWPWTPVPEDGEVSHVASTCTLCPGGCGISVRKVGNRAVKIEGLKEHPVNDGGICLLGLSGLQLLYSPTRVKTPLKRVGQRGAGSWAKVSWESAMSEIADKLRDLRSKEASHKVGFVCGSDRGTIPRLISRLLTVYGSPNFVRMPSIQDNYEMSLHLSQGVQARAGFDFENSDFVLSFGSGIIDGWGSPAWMFKTHSRWKETGAKVVQVEPRLSNTATKADTWIPINPGTEVALALGMAHVIVKESIFKKAMIDNHASGFQEWRQHLVDKYSPNKVARITGVDKSTLISLARRFSQAKKPIAICGRGQGQTPGSISEFMAVHALNALVGGVNKPGGIWTIPEPDYISWPELEMDSTASAGMQNERLDGAGGEKYPDSRYLMSRFIKAVAAGTPYPLEVLFVANSNPRYTMPDTQTVGKAFDKVPFVVSFSSFMDETAVNADYVLPDHVYLERYEDIPEAVGFNKPIIGLTKPVVEPQFDTRHLGDTIIGLAKELDTPIAEAFEWEDYAACLEDTMAGKWEQLVEEGYWYEADFQPPGWADSFETDSGKLELFSNDIQPYTIPNPVKIEGDSKTYPLILISYDSIRLANGFIGDPPFAIKTVADTVLKGKDIFVEINPKTAATLGLSEGRYAVLKTPKGQAKVRVHLFEGLMPGLVAMPKGLGHTAYDKFLAGKGVNFNSLVGPVEDPVSGHDAAWGIRANIAKA